jgi:uncharacterized membrane protein YqjE
MERSEHTEPRAPGLIGSVSGLVKTTLRLVMSRVELALAELSEVRDHLVKLAVLFALAILAAWFAIAFGTATLVFLVWETLGWKILLILAAVFAVLAFVLVKSAMKLIRGGFLGMPATLAEIKADRDMLL